MEFRLESIYFNMIRSGQKVVEVRLNDEKRQALRVGDTLTFKRIGNLDDTIETTVVALNYYKNFEEMLMFEPKADIGFPFKSFREIIDTYEEFYPKEEQARYGVVAIRIRKK